MPNTITVTIDGRSVTGAPDQLRKLLSTGDTPPAPPALPTHPTMTDAIREVVVSDFKLPIARAAIAKYPDANWIEEKVVRLVLPAFDNLEPRRRRARRVVPHVSTIGKFADYVRARATQEPQLAQPIADAYNLADKRTKGQKVNVGNFHTIGGIEVGGPPDAPTFYLK